VEESDAVTGEEAVLFFSNSKLPEDVLASIWDLADTDNSGRLNRDEFAIAMYFIRKQRSNPYGSELLPEVLPASLIPPSMRQQRRLTDPCIICASSLIVVIS
jgi:epidermal growth factor receptor substrate 15